MENKLQKYHKVELLIKTTVNNVQMPSVTKLEFNDCWLTVVGDYISVTIEDTEEGTTTSRLFSLSEVSAYKTYKHNKK